METDLSELLYDIRCRYNRDRDNLEFVLKYLHHTCVFFEDQLDEIEVDVIVDLKEFLDEILIPESLQQRISVLQYKFNEILRGEYEREEAAEFERRNPLGFHGLSQHDFI